MSETVAFEDRLDRIRTLASRIERAGSLDIPNIKRDSVEALRLIAAELGEIRVRLATRGG